jgi:hypothetical protein
MGMLMRPPMRPPTRVPNGLTVFAALSIATSVAACSSGERSRASDSATKSVEAVPPSRTSGAASTPAGDSVGIINRTGAVLLSVARDSVSMGFSPATIAKVRRETDTTGSGSGFGAMIERTVKSGVQTMLSTRVMVPLADIENVRYEDGTIKFDYRTRPRGMKLEDIKIDNEPALQSFREEDARTFVSAVQARLPAR